tara:strand:+ start:862 stop:1080 length:219 start_codon:yes stop_codon:yes gene_type:complete
MAPAIAAPCRVSKSIAEEISATDISELRLNVLAGYLDIQRGVNDSVSANGRACADDEQWLELITLDVCRKGW